MTPYINIHTHHLSKDDGVFLFNNRFGFDKELYTKSYFSIGIHPWDADIEFSKIEFENFISHQNCLAIGECGLDKVIDVDLELQKNIFISQLDLAVKFQKPVLIHCVKAFDELIKICSSYHSKIPLVIHGFNKSFQLAKQLTDKGFYISLNHSVFKKEDLDFNVLPVHKLFLETDNNEFILIEDVYKAAAASFHINTDDLKEKIYSNFTTIFNTNGR
jgi:TatD DNase family protein